MDNSAPDDLLQYLPSWSENESYPAPDSEALGPAGGDGVPLYEQDGPPLPPAAAPGNFPVGPTGPPGTVGPVGETGTQGTRGSTGPRGGAGTRGVTGPTGNPGNRGPIGIFGARGTKGRIVATRCGNIVFSCMEAERPYLACTFVNATSGTLELDPKFRHSIAPGSAFVLAAVPARASRPRVAIEGERVVVECDCPVTVTIAGIRRDFSDWCAPLTTDEHRVTSQRFFAREWN